MKNKDPKPLEFDTMEELLKFLQDNYSFPDLNGDIELVQMEEE
jgi:hypothetical protein